MKQIPKDPVIASASGAILTLLGALHVAELLAITADELAMAVGAVVTILTAIRALHLRGNTDCSEDQHAKKVKE